ncbi:MAG: Uncharacterised protein [Flavobacteriia bacterium]|nr:MAG: Uncharacterised protein [Flavobacteriia bacterium]
MKGTPQEEQYFESTNIILYIYNWRRPLLIASVIGAVLSTVFSGPRFITPLFKSEVVVFPSTTHSVSRAVLPQNFPSGSDVMEFGDEQEAENLLQVLNSDEIRQRIIDSYDLMRHYRIPKDSKFRYTALNKAYENRVQFSRTEFMSVVITVLDSDPDTAALIANDISDLLNEVKGRIKKERAIKGLQIVEQEFLNLRSELDSMEFELTKLRERGVHDYESQAEVFSEQLGIAIVKGNDKAARQIQLRLDTLAKYGSFYVALRDESRILKDELVRLKTRYDQAKVDVYQTLPETFLVNRAFPAERKTFPKRSLIVLISTLGTFLFTLVCIIITDTIRSQKKA